MIRRLFQVALAVALTAGLAACGSSGDGGSDGAKATTTAAVTSTTAAVTTTADGTGTTTAGTPDALPPCDDINQEYTNSFTPDDLTGATAFFQKYAPLMPAEVAAASLRIADAYEAAGDLTKLDLADTDLTADAQTFTDWITAGCPPG